MLKAKRPRRPVSRDKVAADAAQPEFQYCFGALEPLVGFAVRCMHQYLGSGLATIVEREGLKPHQFTALSLIVDNPGISQRDLAQALSIKPSNMVPLIDELEIRRLVKRNPATTNRRSYALTASRDGQRLRDRALALISTHEDSLLHFLDGKERALLTGLTQKFLALVRA